MMFQELKKVKKKQLLLVLIKLQLDRQKKRQPMVNTALNQL